MTTDITITALRAENERLTGERDRQYQQNAEQITRIAALETENKRLRAALLAFAKHFGPLEDNIMLHEGVRECFRLARAALGEKP